jgi:hypothetical protein
VWAATTAALGAHPGAHPGAHLAQLPELLQRGGALLGRLLLRRHLPLQRRRLPPLQLQRALSLEQPRQRAPDLLLARPLRRRRLGRLLQRRRRAAGRRLLRRRQLLAQLGLGGLRRRQLLAQG